MEYTNTHTTWNKIRTRGIQTVRIYIQRPMNAPDSDDEETQQTVMYRYSLVTQQPDGTEKTGTELTGNLFAQDSRVCQVWWVDNYYWVVKTDANSALYYGTECVVKFPTTASCNFTLRTEMVIEPQSADIETKIITTRATDGRKKQRTERKFSISYYQTDKPFDSGNEDTLIYELPIPEDEIKRTKQQQAYARLMCHVAEGYDAQLPDPVGCNIKDYLTPKSRPYFEYVNKLLTRMLKSTNNKFASAAVFGGYVLNLVEHAFEYRSDPLEATYTPPKDLDVWLSYDASQGRTEFSRNKISKIFEQNVIPYLEEAGHTTSWGTVQANHRLDYGVHNLIVDGEYRFDFTGNTYGNSLFDDLGDFTVNNLFYDVYTGKMGTRVTSEYTLRDIISDHIRNRKLVPLLRCDRLQRYIRDESDYDWYYNKMRQREMKTLAKGFKYPWRLDSLPETFTEGMREHLAKITPSVQAE
jgi:hypothetical protein